MTATNKALSPGVTTSGTAVETVYISPAAGKGTRITSVTTVNTSGSVGNYSLYAVDDATPAVAVDSLVREQSLQPNESDTPPEAINHFIPPGGTIQVQTDVAGNVAFRISGIEYT